jgi:hypothetical protein
VRQCAAHYLMLPGRRRVVPPKLQDLDSCAQLVQNGPSAAQYSGSGQSCVHEQPCMREQLCMQELGVAACFLLECCYLIYMCWLVEHTLLQEG